MTPWTSTSPPLAVAWSPVQSSIARTLPGRAPASEGVANFSAPELARDATAEVRAQLETMTHIAEGYRRDAEEFHCDAEGLRHELRELREVEARHEADTEALISHVEQLQSMLAHQIDTCNTEKLLRERTVLEEGQLFSQCRSLEEVSAEQAAAIEKLREERSEALLEESRACGAPWGTPNSGPVGFEDKGQVHDPHDRDSELPLSALAASLRKLVDTSALYLASAQTTREEHGSPLGMRLSREFPSSNHWWPRGPETSSLPQSSRRAQLSRSSSLPVTPRCVPHLLEQQRMQLGAELHRSQPQNSVASPATPAAGAQRRGEPTLLGSGSTARRRPNKCREGLGVTPAATAQHVRQPVRSLRSSAFRAHARPGAPVTSKHAILARKRTDPFGETSQEASSQFADGFLHDANVELSQRGSTAEFVEARHMFEDALCEARQLVGAAERLLIKDPAVTVHESRLDTLDKAL